MKNLIYSTCLMAFFFLTACGDSASAPETAAATDQTDAIELTEEEAQILEAVEAAPLEEAEPVTKDNYEDALKQLEEELDAQ